MKNLKLTTSSYRYAAPLPASENAIFAALVACGGVATAAELETAVNNPDCGLPLIYTLLTRLTKRGLVRAESQHYQLGKWKGVRKTYFATEQSKQLNPQLLEGGNRYPEPDQAVPATRMAAALG